MFKYWLKAIRVAAHVMSHRSHFRSIDAIGIVLSLDCHHFRILVMEKGSHTRIYHSIEEMLRWKYYKSWTEPAHAAYRYSRSYKTFLRKLLKYSQIIE